MPPVFASFCLPAVLAWAPAPDSAEPAPPSPASSPTSSTTTKNEAQAEERDIEVSTDSLDLTEPAQVFRHAGTRTVVDSSEARTLGASAVGDALRRTPAVRSMAGNAGLGSASTKLNVAGRGVNPRFSARTSVLLDEVPIATAPYGRPQLALFPLSLFSIAKMDVALGGSSIRFGPQTSGGVINLVSQPIPSHPTTTTFAQRDHFGDTSLGAAFGSTVRVHGTGKLGVYAEYAPRFGSSYRDHSSIHVHGGLLKLRYAPRSSVSLTATNHAYWENVEIAGGLPPDAFARNPHSSVRPHDHFDGWRAGTSLKLRVRSPDRQELQVIGYYHHTDRTSFVATGPNVLTDSLRTQPRRYDASGIEPRLTVRLRHRGGAFHDVAFGLRGAYEAASFRGEQAALATPVATTTTSYDVARIVAASAYIEDKLYLFDADVVLTFGVRAEMVSITRHDRIADELGHHTYAAPLPGASVWAAVAPHVGLFAGYGRSFGPPEFLQLAVAQDDTQLRAETADTPELGIKTFALAGFDASVTGWLKRFDNFIDVSLEDIDQPGDTLAVGTETQVEWRADDPVPALTGVHLWVGHAFTRGRITTGPLQGNRLPWYPLHSVSAGASYTTSAGYYVTAAVRHDGEYFSDYANTIESDGTGGIGLVPAATTTDLGAGLRRAWNSSQWLEFGIGVNNVFDEAWISRTDDRNAGILPQRPRTIFVTVGLTQRGR